MRDLPVHPPVSTFTSKLLCFSFKAEHIKDPPAVKRIFVPKNTTSLPDEHDNSKYEGRTVKKKKRCELIYQPHELILCQLLLFLWLFTDNKA